MTPRNRVIQSNNVFSVVGRGGFIDVCPHDKDGGCWGVAHVASCRTRGVFIDFYFTLDDAIAAARLAAERLGATFDEGAAT